MKLAEALQERADLNRKIEQLQQRMTNNALVQEGEQPAESIDELFTVLNEALNRLSWIITRINLTNASVTLNGKTLTELIASKDVLMMKISAYRTVTAEAGSASYRARGTEIKILPTVKVSDLQKEIDRMSGELRKIDNLLQETNWKTELME